MGGGGEWVNLPFYNFLNSYRLIIRAINIFKNSYFLPWCFLIHNNNMIFWVGKCIFLQPLPFMSHKYAVNVSLSVCFFLSFYQMFLFMLSSLLIWHPPLPSWSGIFILPAICCLPRKKLFTQHKPTRYPVDCLFICLYYKYPLYVLVSDAVQHMQQFSGACVGEAVSDPLYRLSWQ